MDAEPEDAQDVEESPGDVTVGTAGVDPEDGAVRAVFDDGDSVAQWDPVDGGNAPYPFGEDAHSGSGMNDGHAKSCSAGG